MKKIMTSLAVLALVVVSLQAGPKVVLKYSGPGNQGNLIWWAPSSGITNLVMSTNGISVFNAAAGSAVVWTNASLTITRQAVPSVTNVSAVALRQANLTMTNIVVATGYPVINDVTGTVLFVTGVTIQTAPVAALTNTALTVQSASVAAVTNVVLSNP